MDSQGEDVTNRRVQNYKAAYVMLICFFNKMVFRAVWLSSSRVTRICCLISEKRIVRIRQNLVRSFVIDCFMGAHDGFMNKTKRAEN